MERDGDDDVHDDQVCLSSTRETCPSSSFRPLEVGPSFASMPPPPALRIERVLGGRINLKSFGTGAAFLRYTRAMQSGEGYLTDVDCESDDDDDD